MDNTRFDALARGLSTSESRRRLLAHLAALPTLGGLLAILDPDDSEGAGRRKRRKKAHKHGKGRRRKHNKRCKAETVAQTCAGKCGSVLNNCKRAVECGPCWCDPACPSCQVCDEEAGQCVADPGQAGDACGDPGQVCQANGACACTATSCPACTTCGSDGICTACTNCCDSAGVCQAGDTNAACGSSGTCAICTGQEQCQGKTCVCLPNCSGKACGAGDGCGGICTTGSCPTDQTCQLNGTCLQNVNLFQCLCGDNTTPSGCNRSRCPQGFDTVCSGLCTGHSGYFGFGTPGTGCGPGTCPP
ncbi:MAG: hypothetical protein U0075_10780 [Thermomicrobiales bacterium]